MFKDASVRKLSHRRQSAVPPVEMLLCDAGYYGTLAAVRSLGRAGVPVVTVDPSILVAGRHSRYTKLHLTSPPFDSDEWPEWLLALGRGGPRRAIYATSDAVSYALAVHRAELSAYFDLYQPDLDTMMCLLDKGALLQHARSVGIDTPDTWMPTSADEAERIVRDAGGQFVVKPRSQLAVRTGTKGMIIESAVNRGRKAFEHLLQHGASRNAFAKQFPEATMPLFQRFHAEAAQMIYSLSGFRDRTGKLVVMRAARKILQCPKELGIGLCFEEAELNSALAEKTRRLCELIGYYGAFELEFIVSKGRLLLIDFNGRFYHQLAFDIARGMDLPRLVYAGATNDQRQLVRLIAQVPRRDKGGELTFCDSFGLSLAVGMQRAVGKISKMELARVREFRENSDDRLVDPIRAFDDPMPAHVDRARQIWRQIRHSRTFIRDLLARLRATNGEGSLQAVAALLTSGVGF